MDAEKESDESQIASSISTTEQKNISKAKKLSNKKNEQTKHEKVNAIQEVYDKALNSQSHESVTTDNISEQEKTTTNDTSNRTASKQTKSRTSSKTRVNKAPESSTTQEINPAPRR